MVPVYAASSVAVTAAAVWVRMRYTAPASLTFPVTMMTFPAAVAEGALEKVIVAFPLVAARVPASITATVLMTACFRSHHQLGYFIPMSRYTSFAIAPIFVISAVVVVGILR